MSPHVDLNRTIVVSGFWRSGTTWLQELLAAMIDAKTVFEPFHPLASKPLFEELMPDKSDLFVELFMPYCAAEKFGEHALGEFFGKALRADLPGKAIRVLRTSLRQAARRRVVVKVVRAHLCLRGIHDTFSVPIIHVVRDPRAVLASIKMTNWRWLFDHLSLQEQLLEPLDGRAAYFGHWRDDLLEYDRRDLATKITAYWALTESFVRDEFARRHGGRVCFVSYEDLCLGGTARVQAALADLGLGSISAVRRDALARDSFSTSAKRRGLTAEERVYGWRTKLTPVEVSTVEEIVNRFGLTDRLCDRP